MIVPRVSNLATTGLFREFRYTNLRWPKLFYRNCNSSQKPEHGKTQSKMQAFANTMHGERIHLNTSFLSPSLDKMAGVTEASSDIAFLSTDQGDCHKRYMKL